MHNVNIIIVILCVISDCSTSTILCNCKRKSDGDSVDQKPWFWTKRSKSYSSNNYCAL